MRDSGEYRVVNGQVERRKKPALIRGLNWNHNHEMKNVFKAQPLRPVPATECFTSSTSGC